MVCYDHSQLMWHGPDRGVWPQGCRVIFRLKLPLLVCAGLLALPACDHAFLPTGSAGGTIQQAFTAEGKCQAIIDWLRKFEHEYPDIKMQAAFGRYNSEIANLYRDTYFVPVFSISYEEKNAPQILKINQDVLSQCYGFKGKIDPEIEARFSTLKFFLDGGFYFKPHLAKMAAERKELERWIILAMEHSQNLEPTVENLAMLYTIYIKPAKEMLRPLWPSERSDLMDLLVQRRKRLVEALDARR